VPLDRLEDQFGSLMLAKIRPRDVAGYVRHAMTEKRAKTAKPLSAKTVNLDLTVLRLIMESAQREELADRNPCDSMERPKKRRRWRILEPVEVGRVAQEFIDDRARAVFLVLMLTAVRNFELRALKWKDVDLIGNVLRVRDSKSEMGERLIALSTTAAEVLWTHRRQSRFQGDDEYVFCHPQRGSPLRTEWFADELRAALRAAAGGL
jgi:integrase